MPTHSGFITSFLQAYPSTFLDLMSSIPSPITLANGGGVTGSYMVIGNLIIQFSTSPITQFNTGVAITFPLPKFNCYGMCASCAQTNRTVSLSFTSSSQTSVATFIIDVYITPATVNWFAWGTFDTTSGSPYHITGSIFSGYITEFQNHTPPAYNSGFYDIISAIIYGQAGTSNPANPSIPPRVLYNTTYVVIGQFLFQFNTTPINTSDATIQFPINFYSATNVGVMAIDAARNDCNVSVSTITVSSFNIRTATTNISWIAWGLYV